MSTGTLAAGEAPGQQDDGVPFGTRLQDLAQQRGEELAVVILTPD
jgi:bile acid-coenzyme A ligase